MSNIERLLKAMELARGGATVAELAERLNISVSTARKMVNRYKIPVRRMRLNVNVDEVVYRFMHGESIESIEADLGINRQDLNEWVLKEKGVELFRMTVGSNGKKRRYNPNDGRSYVCQQIEFCREERCYRKADCPAYAAYVSKQYQKGA